MRKSDSHNHVTQEELMNRGKFMVVASLIFALILAFGASWQMRAQDAKGPYPSMAPLDQYLMADRNGEIALARSAAPEAISREATLLVCAKPGYETATHATNSLTHTVDRSPR